MSDWENREDGNNQATKYGLRSYRQIIEEKIGSVVSDFSRIVDNTRTAFNAVCDDASFALKSRIEQACSTFQANLKANLDDYAKDQKKDWRENILEEMAAWLYELTDVEVNSLQEEVEFENEQAPPDLFTFLSEFSGLKQEVRLQAKAAQMLTEKTDNILSSVKSEFTEHGNRLLDTTMSLKSQLSQARREGEDSIIREFLSARDSICGTLEVWQNKQEKKLPWYKGSSSLKPEIVESLEMLSRKIEDSFNRLNIVVMCKEGMDFNPAFMRAVGTSDKPDAKPGTIARVVRQGYKKDERILQIAEVIVYKSGEEKNG